ncbi:hypothetical protein GGR54DRAFT_613620 [Hypoxylon sp. NC1633]|nr:hypothetical protein GGR54DRAFT_613620 [Hypoxylon sp. NC1633]
MAPGQNILSIIPNAPCAINNGLDAAQSRPSKRPMTTKQAKKAYQTANKGPKLSKAERRRQELFEQDRIRKEFEKERNQSRARAARDKKKEKEERERAERKKKGLPLVDVRPSQDTIARFVRGNGKKQKSEELSLPVTNGDDSDSCSLSAEDEPGPPPKKPKTASPVPISVNADLERSPSFAGVVDRSVRSAQDINGAEDLPEVDGRPEDNSIAKRTDFEIYDEASLDLLHDAIFDEFTVAADELMQVKEPESSKDQVIADNPSQSKLPVDHLRPPTSTPQLLPKHRAGDSASPSIRKPLQNLATEAVNARDGSRRDGLAHDQGKSTPPARQPIADLPARPSQRTQPSARTAPSFPHYKTPMGPPPVPPKFKSRNHVFAQESKTPPTLLKQSNALITPKPNPNSARRLQLQEPRGEDLPTSTQLFMISNLDDLFPSPSQEVREIFEEPKSSIRTDNNQTKPGTTCFTRSPLDRNLLAHSISSMPNVNQPVPVTKVDKTNGPVQDDAYSDEPKIPTCLPAANAHSPGTSDVYSMPFFSTQDFLLSSQDVKDLEDEPSSVKAKDTGPSCQPPKDIQAPSTSIRPPKNPDTARMVTLSPRSETEKCRLYARGLRNETWQTGKSGSVTLATKASRQKSVSGMLQPKCAAPPRPSPKPFFASSGGGALYEYVIERSKTTAWEDASARRKAQEKLERFQKSENERLDRLLLERMVEEESHIGDSCASASRPKSTPLYSSPRLHNQPNDQSQPRSINQLPGSLSPRSQKSDYPISQDRQRQVRLRSSYEQMLQLLDRKENEKQVQQVVVGSQETDYGDAGLDDDILCEIL